MAGRNMKKTLFIILAALAVFVTPGCNRTELVPPQVEKVTISASAKTLFVGQSCTLIAKAVPSNADDTTITWTSDNEAVASVSMGLVQANALGTATIKATSANGKSASCVITVTSSPIPVESVAFDKEEYSVILDGTLVLVPQILPEEATDKSVSWDVDKEDVAVVVGGVVKALKLGTAKITATSSNGKSASCLVTVLPKPVRATGVSLDYSTVDVSVGRKITLTASVLPMDATNKNVSWSIDKPALASVANGVVTGIAIGQAKVTVTTEDGGFTASCVVNVVEAKDERTDNSLTENVGGKFEDYIWNK